MFKNYYEVRGWLESFIPEVYGKEELGLVRIENLLAFLGNPQKKFKSIHVAGTSGKGTTCWFIAALLQQFAGPVSSFPPASALSDLKSIVDGKDNPDLRAVGSPSRTATHKLKIGLHTSPHLVDIRERMQIVGGQRPVARDQEENLMPIGQFLKLFDQIRPVVDAIQKEKPGLTPSYFEILTAATFLYFAAEKVDFAVVEVGLGGRLDATNVLLPEVCVITNIGLDHVEILGNTVEKIAFEKAGIIKPGVPIITGASGKALNVIKKVAKEKDAKMININTQSVPKSLIGRPFSLSILLAKKAVKEVLKGYQGYQEYQGFFKKSLPGRLEEIENPTSPEGLRGTSGVILDGAHNPDKIRFLIESLRNSQADGVILVIGFKKGKDWKKMVDLLIKNLPVVQIIATKYQAVTDTGKGSAVEPEEIARYVSSIQYPVSSKAIANSQEAVFEAIQNTEYPILNTVLVTGSLYLVGEARTLWKLPEF